MGKLINRVSNYNDFLFDMILESTKIGNMPFKFSERFEFIISRINHPIAKKLIEIENESTPITLIDITNENDKVSFTNSPKVIEFLSGVYNQEKDKILNRDLFIYLNTTSATKQIDDEIWKKYRSDIKVGKLVKKIFGDDYDSTEIENFVNLYKYSYGLDDINSLFDIVKGKDIVKWYQYNNYVYSSEDTVLHQSCMAKNCEEMLNFYAINDKIEMLILYENHSKEKIVGRALVWHLDEPKDRIFLDRIYTMHDHYIDFFKTYAKNNGWIYKVRQSYDENPFVDSETGEMKEMTLTVNNIKLNDVYPYMDTLKYLDQDDKILSNDNISDIKLNGTQGAPFDSEWSDLYKKWINMYNVGSNDYVLCEVGVDDLYNDIDKVRKKEDAVYLDYYASWIPKDRFDEYVVQQTLGGNNLLLKDDAIYLNHYKEWAEEGFVKRELKYSGYFSDWFYKEDLVFSKFMNSYLFKDKSTKVYTDITKSEIDYLPDSELDELTYTNKGDYVIKK